MAVSAILEILPSAEKASPALTSRPVVPFPDASPARRASAVPRVQAAPKPDEVVFPRLLPQTDHRWHGVLAALLPRAWTVPRGTALAEGVAADFLLITAAVVAVRPWFACLGLRTVRFTDALGFALFQATIATLLCYSEGLYQPHTQRERTRGLAKVMIYSTGLTCAGAYLCGHNASLLLTASLVASLLLMEGWRRIHLPEARNLRNVVVVGERKVAQRVGRELQGVPARNYCGFVSSPPAAGSGALGTIHDLGWIARREFVDEIILASPHDPQLVELVLFEAERAHLDVKMVPDAFGVGEQELGVEVCAGLPFLTLREEHLPELGVEAKRALDIFLSTILLIVLSPLLALIALAIKMDSGGPALYLADRAGRKGRPFLCCKFRTMIAGSDLLKERLRARNERQGPCFKITGDPRVTRIGRFLRRYSLDELPQLWNVVRGDMSLVGPRPHPLDDVSRYKLEHLQRLDVPPGLTGLWQIQARHDPSFDRNMELDVEYIRHWTLLGDLKILLRTALVVVRGEGR